MKRRNKAGAILSISVLLVATRPVMSGMVTFSAGSWNVHSGSGSVSLFSKLSASAYFSLLDIPAAVDLPLAVTTRFHSGDYAGHRVAPGDLGFYFGKAVGPVQARLGMALPLFYGTEGEWIGSMNVRVRAGAGFRTAGGSDEIGFSAELMASTSLDNPRGLLKSPSTDLSIGLKNSYRLDDRWLIGGELYTSGKYSKWSYWRTPYDGENVKEWGYGVMTMVFGQHRFTPGWFASVKAGVGPSYRISSALLPLAAARGNWSWASNLGISSNHYF